MYDRGRAANKKIALKDVAVTYGRQTSGPLGAPYNPFGLSVWWGIEQMAFVFIMKRLVLFGAPTARGLHLRGLRQSAARQELFQPGRAPTLQQYLREAARMLFVGKPFTRLNAPVRLRPTSTVDLRLMRVN